MLGHSDCLQPSCIQEGPAILDFAACTSKLESPQSPRPPGAARGKTRPHGAFPSTTTTTTPFLPSASPPTRAGRVGAGSGRARLLARAGPARVAPSDHRRAGRLVGKEGLDVVARVEDHQVLDPLPLPRKGASMSGITGREREGEEGRGRVQGGGMSHQVLDPPPLPSAGREGSRQQ